MKNKLAMILFLSVLLVKVHSTDKNTHLADYRFVIAGDFDGDGIQEKLIEQYVRQIDYKEITKFPDDIADYDSLIAHAISQNPISFAISDNPLIDTLFFSLDNYQFGVLYIKNEGDLDGDKGDEVSFVVNNADYSSVNECYIYTYKKGKWTELYSFSMWEWLLPDFPGVYREYGLLGLANHHVIQDDSINNDIEEELHLFEGLIRKKEDRIIEIIHKNDEAELVLSTVDLKKKKIMTSQPYDYK